MFVLLLSINYSLQQFCIKFLKFYACLMLSIVQENAVKTSWLLVYSLIQYVFLTKSQSTIIRKKPLYFSISDLPYMFQIVQNSTKTPGLFRATYRLCSHNLFNIREEFIRRVFSVGICISDITAVSNSFYKNLISYALKHFRDKEVFAPITKSVCLQR